MNTSLGYRPNVCLLVCNSHYKLFLGQRLGERGVWQLPQGGVEPDTTIEENVIREVHEELGVDAHYLNIQKKLKATHQYEFAKIPDYAVGKWRGQVQTFWIVQFLGADSAIQLERFEAEFGDWRWCSVGEVIAMAEPRRLGGYLPALQEYEEWVISQRVGTSINKV